MQIKSFSHVAALGLSALFSAALSAAPPATSPYVTDEQNEYVQDATSDAVGSVNMVLCIINALNVNGSGMLNVGPYIALVDVNKCQGHRSSGSSGASGADNATNFMTAVVDATRVTSSDPMAAKVWMQLTENGEVKNIYVKLSASLSPADAPPYGVFRLDYIGIDPSLAVMFNGFINSAAGNLQFYETGQNSSNTGLSMTVGSTTSGSGTITTLQPAGTFNFNYNPDNFRRSDGNHDQCFDRKKANADRSVWRYGTYNATDGTHLDQTNPNFQILATYAGTSYYGNAGYFGFNFQGLDLNTIPDASPVTGLTITDQRAANTTTYNLSKVSGKLTKWTQNATTLAAMDGIPFYFNGDLTNKTSNTTDLSGWGNWQMQWNNANANFTVTGTQNCGGNGCSVAALTTPATVNTGALNGLSLSGWSDSFGGNINIPSAMSDHVGGDAVFYFSQSLVIPGSASEPTTLYCLSNCPSAASVATANAYSSGNAPSPFDGLTASQWFAAPNSGDTISYTFGRAGLTNGGNPMIISNAAFYNASNMFQHGLMTGRLFTAPFASCTQGVCEPSAPSVYYTWSTGLGQWNQTMWLTKTSDSSIVAFDPPQTIAYTVPTGSTYGTWAGKNIQLQFNGFGNLNGIPGYCVNPVDNSASDCAVQGARYVAAFAIPDGAAMTLGGTAVLVKALDAEIRLRDLGANASQCLAMSLTPLTPPAGGVHDMSNPTDSFYIGVKPAITTSPKVIDGIVQ